MSLILNMSTSSYYNYRKIQEGSDFQMDDFDRERSGIYNKRVQGDRG